MKQLLALAALILATTPHILLAQSAPLRFKQLRDTDPLILLSSSEVAVLGDPLFQLLLKNKANLVSLAAIETTLQPEATNRHLFVVDERIATSARSGSRRSVLTFSGSNSGEILDGNVMLSMSFGPAGLQDSSEIEAWGWDNHRQRYNYYKLDSAGSNDGELLWKFRTSSENADLRSPSERAGTCLACHISGAPVMKELFFPWNNWHAGVGGSFCATYLERDSLGANSWPAASTPRFAGLTGANSLEGNFLFAAFHRFNESRLNAMLKRDDSTGNRAVNSAGRMTVLEARRLLRPLFVTTEINLYSSRDVSGIHPLGSASDFVPNLNVRLPADQFFLNTDLIAGDGEGKLRGLKIAAARDFSSFANLTEQENRDLIQKFGLQLNGTTGDTHFAWLVPGEAYLNNELIDQCLTVGVITPHFLAAALAVDLEMPVFSVKRAELLQFLPEQFEFTPRLGNNLTGTTPAEDSLTQAVVASIDRANPAAHSAADEFRALLKSANAVTELQGRVAAYVSREKAALDAAPENASQRKAELERLFNILVDRRKLLEANPTLRKLDETGGRLLLPLPLAH